MDSYDGEPAYAAELSRTMDVALARLPVDAELLLTGSLVRGTRRRRRRRAAAWGTACSAAVALTATALLVVLPGGRSGPVTVALPEFAATGAPAPAGREPATGAATAALLVKLLPGQPEVTDVQTRDSDPAYTSVQTYGRVTLASGGTVAVWLQGDYVREPVREPLPRSTAGARDPKQQPWEDGKGAVATPTHAPARDDLERHYSCPAEQEAKTCRIVKLADGSVLLAYEDPSNSLTSRTADVLRPDGTRVTVTATGTGFGMDQLRAVASSDRWSEWVDPATNAAADRSDPATSKSRP
ncbi:hypothetical protein ACFYWN_18305 [Streptomyces sp. NPDC002917]|uniref:hypothetical protein n=1 Tax=unclassified Streptomyces TaxID=2593676 RepID=UPI002E80418E|nr:hypothetical protein [Streptomyces sp. NBC_00562]WUC21126.1 hypothetical protein OHA33_20930 [Streptomyces sp. NBC_00562]